MRVHFAIGGTRNNASCLLKDLLIIPIVRSSLEEMAADVFCQVAELGSIA